jgi:hypothetical protein
MWSSLGQINTDTVFQTLNVIASALIAWFIYYQAKASNFDNRVATLPYLILIDENDIHPSNDGEKYNFSYGVANQGIGPAVLKKWTFDYDGESHSFARNEDLFEFLNDRCPVPITDQNSRKFTSSDVIPSEQSLELVNIETDIENKDRFIEFMRDSFIEKLNFRIYYQSIYEDETFILDSHQGHIDWTMA